MALFKINKGKKNNLPKTYNEGYCYFTTDDGKFYIDTTNTAAGRILLNAGKADTATKATQDGAGNTITSTYLKLSGGTLTGDIYAPCYTTNRAISAIPEGTAEGWYRCASFTGESGVSHNFILSIRRNYHSPENEGYLFSISNDRDSVNITQLSGSTGGHLLTKIRVNIDANYNIHVDYYMTSNGVASHKNTWYISGWGDGTVYTPYLVSSYTGSVTEFETVTGLKNNVGYIGNASTATNVAWSGITSKPSYYDAKAIKSITRSGTTFTYTRLDGTTGTFTQQDNNTTYSAGTGISLSGTTFSNSGVRSIATGTSNGTISVNTNGTTTNVAVKGLGSAAYTASTTYAAASHTHDYNSLGLYDGFFRSERDFTNGALIQTSIDYSQTSGAPWTIEIKGNSYGSEYPFSFRYQGYIWNNSILNHGGIMSGATITGISLFNYNGNLCFYIPRQVYWQGFAVYVAQEFSGIQTNKVTSITDVVKPTNITKEVALTNIRYNTYGLSCSLSGTTLTITDNK